ncbi:hybrid sensor histidine kinase/response regulator [Tabrizicola sp. TH137]|uniref:hybrid sensor histidine kinase/response regulator n=1 Tax=Tabrizicola sp. TH137 TaxID=2067452 RepID=UPI000C7BBA62|nr:ATP-binding protein [Tabrizicola sp. TH137]PLL11028.1 hybrid sensor histidine kinase/response regulator [Tabrizicola sp. TH137]
MPRHWGGRIRVGLILAVAALFLGAILVLVQDVRARLLALERANSDNTQWAMMQTEVEILRLQAALLAARDAPVSSDLDEVRRWFNVLYSRVSMLEESGIYAPLLAAPENADDHRALRDYLNATVPLIDSPDSALLAGLPQVAAPLPELRAAARRMTLNALSDFAAQSDLNRNSMAETLIRLAGVTGALMAMLAAAAIILRRAFRRAEAQGAALRQTGSRLSTIFATSADAIIVTDETGIIRDFNPAAEMIFALPAAAATGQHALSLLFAEGPDGPQGQALIAAIRDPQTRTAPLRIEVDARRSDGHVFPAEVSIARGGQETGGLIVAFVRDISDRRRAEADLLQARDRALAGEKAKADFLAVMSHEMRTPLNGLIGSMDLMRRTGLTAPQSELMAVMQSSGDILLGHVNSVLDVSRAEAGALPRQSGPFDLESLIEECLANQAGLAASAGNDLAALQPAGPVGTVIGEGGRLRQILLNLIGNAVKFTRNGTVTVEAERLPGPGDMVEIRVIDTGIGIPEADLGRIFDPFVTLDASYGREAGGTGLGLAIARRLAQAMGGDIGAESEPGEGSLFWLRLPMPRATQHQTSAAPADAAAATLPAAPPSAILLVEDNAINRLLLRRFLEAGGHAVTEAADGVEGVARAQEREFDLILMDISMPRMDGIAAARAIRSGGGPSAQTPIYALTAHALPADRARFHEAGMQATLAKPIGQHALLAAVAGQLLDLPDTPPAPDAAPLLDPTTLGDLVRHIGPPTARNLLQRLIDDGDHAMQRLALGDVEDDAPLLARTCHQLAGTSGTFGTAHLRAALIRAEAAIQAGDAETARRLVADLPAVWQATRNALILERDRLAAA